MEKPAIPRSELKYIISNQEYVYLKTLLSAVMNQDCHSNRNGDYYIRSLYLDSYTNNDYHTKDAGLEKRKKIRLRLYDLESDLIKFEIKNKENHYTLKETATISKEDLPSILSGSYEVLLKYQQSAINNLYKHLKTDAFYPVVMIDYEREAFVNEALGIRINFDKNIRATYSTLSLYDTLTDLTNMMETHLMVLEVKFNGILPDFYRDILSSSKLIKTSYSKYVFARELQI